MPRPLKSLAVYCGSAAPADPIYIETAREVGRTFARRGIRLVYGGGRLGLMGAVADAALEEGGEVIGVIPHQLVGAELAHMGCTELITVNSMHERKQAFTDRSDGFVTLPGGVGTMDELWEAMSWAQLGYHAKPVGLLNVANYYDHLIAFKRQMVEVGFVRPMHAKIMLVASNIGTLIDKLADYEPHQTIFELKASGL